MSYFECKYCLKKYKRKAAFEKHECEQMRRAKVARTNTGIAAFDTYSLWLKTKKYKNHGRDHFVGSKFFVSFIKFTRYSSKMALPCKHKFVELMVELDIYPKDWSSKVVYEHYIKNYEILLTPTEQATVTIDTIFELARIFECDANEIFLHIEAQSVLQIVQAKKLSPWILLFSNKFLGFVKNEMSQEQRLILGKFINYERWGKVFEKHPDDVAKMKEYVKALKL